MLEYLVFDLIDSKREWFGMTKRNARFDQGIYSLEASLKNTIENMGKLVV